MNDFDLPPERRLPDGVKQQMKRDLINQTSEPAPLRGRPGWIAAGVAAVAVAAVAIGGAVLLGGEEQSAPDPLPPAGSGTANDPVPSSPPTETDKPAKAEREATTRVSELPPPVQRSCEDEVADFSQNQGLPAATKRATEPYDGGTMTLWGTDNWWVVCDDWAAVNGGGTPTVIGNHPWPATSLTKELFQISMNFSESEAQYFSGGPVPDGVEKIEYRFSDGKTVAAEIGADMWTMVRVATDGPFGPGQVGPISATVVVTNSGGQTEEFRLEDPSAGGLRDFCAQLNHGC